MSAYALPGLIFPPLPCHDNSSPITDKENGCNEQHFSSSCHCLSNGLNDVDDCRGETKTDSHHGTESVAQVFVKSAKVDIMQLVNSSTERSSTNANSNSSSYKGPIRTFLANRRERRRRLIQRLQSNWSSSRSSPVSEDTRCSTTGSNNSVESPTPSKTGSNPQERAIHFELSVSYHDRTYDGVRSLARIRQLYQELVDGEGYDSDDEEDEEISNSEPCETSRKSYSKQTIPDLPDMFDDNEYAMASNFRSLYGNLTQYYAPAIESWFQSLFAVITPRTSPVLAYFLCEPSMLLKGDSNDPQQQQNSKKSKRSSSRLEIIVEEERLDDDESI